MDGRFLFDRDGSKRTGSDNAFVLFIDELLRIDDPRLFISHLEEHRVQFSAGPTADA